MGLGRIGRDVTCLPSSDGIPIRTINESLIAAGGNGDGAVVLLSTVDVVGRAVVSNHVVELRGRLIILTAPGFSGIEGDCHTTIIGANHAAGISGIDPETVVVAVWKLELIKGAASIGGAIRIHV